MGRTWARVTRRACPTAAAAALALDAIAGVAPASVPKNEGHADVPCRRPRPGRVPHLGGAAGAGNTRRRRDVRGLSEWPSQAVPRRGSRLRPWRPLAPHTPRLPFSTSIFSSVLAVPVSVSRPAKGARPCSRSESLWGVGGSRGRCERLTVLPPGTDRPHASYLGNGVDTTYSLCASRAARASCRTSRYVPRVGPSRALFPAHAWMRGTRPVTRASRHRTRLCSSARSR